METKVAQPTNIYQQLVSNADAQIAALEKEQQALATRLDAIARERTSIDAQAQARQLQIEQATANAAQASVDLATQEAAAKIAQGTAASVHSAEPLAAYSEQEERLRAEKNRLISRAQLQADQDLARLADLHTQEMETLMRQADVEKELTATARAKAAALHDWGEQEYHEATTQLGLADQTIAELTAQLEATRLEKQATFERRLARLAAWPNHQAELGKLIPRDDAITATLEATLAYVDALMTHGRTLPETVLLNSLGPFHQVLDALLYIPRQEGNNPQWLRERRDILAAALVEYRQG